MFIDAAVAAYATIDREIVGMHSTKVPNSRYKSRWQKPFTPLFHSVDFHPVNTVVKCKQSDSLKKAGDGKKIIEFEELS